MILLLNVHLIIIRFYYLMQLSKYFNLFYYHESHLGSFSLNLVDFEISLGGLVPNTW